MDSIHGPTQTADAYEATSEKPAGEAATSDNTTAPELKQEKSSDQPPHSVFGNHQKAFIVATASTAALSSPLSGNIYYPAMQTLSTELHVSLTLISLTITTYLVRQFVPSSEHRTDDKPIDLPRHCTVLCWQLLRSVWPTTSVSALLYDLPGRVYWPGLAEELRCSASASDATELRK